MIAAGPLVADASQQYDSSSELARALADHAVWFPASVLSKIADPELSARAVLHRHGPLAAVVVTDLRPADLPQLADIELGLIATSDPVRRADWASQLARAGLRILLPHGETAEDRIDQPHGSIGRAEFLLSDSDRLRHTQVESRASGTGRRDVVAVGLLDLVQDYEILAPLLQRAAAEGSPFDLRLAVTERVLKSPLWPEVRQFINTQRLEWFTPSGPSDVASALGSRKSLLLTASESSAAAHAFGHAACRVAPPKALRVTMQHGLECIGLRHHSAHDIDFPQGVRFASDLVLTWDHPSKLPDIHPSEIDKCIPVGVIKTMAERASAVAEARWGGEEATRLSRDHRRLLVAENLHSVRFRAPGRYQRFLRFIRAAQFAPDVDLTIRSHPASRTLEKQRQSNQLKFLDNMLRLDDLMAFDAFVSPPSTILLDAVLAGVPAAVWTDAAAAGDIANYRGLAGVSDFAEWASLTHRSRNEDLEWATRSTTALNGVPAAWNVLVHLFR